MFKKTISSLVLLGVGCTPLLAQHNDNRNDTRNNYRDAHHQRYVRHSDWKRGYRMSPDSWRRAQRVGNWRTYHLNAPPPGYEWREVDGNYVLAAVATGIIASVIVAAATH